MRAEHDEHLDDEEPEEYGSRSIFAAGWFRALLVLTVLAILVVISLPYLLNWLDPAPPAVRTAKPAELALSGSSNGPPSPLVPAAPSPVPAPTLRSPPVSTSVPSPAPASKPSVAATDTPSAPLKTAAGKPSPPPAARRPASEKAPASSKPSAPTQVATVEPPNRPVVTAALKTKDAATGNGYWIQLGAFKDQANADSLARTLRGEGFPVEVSAVTRGVGGVSGTAQLHELLVTGTSVEKVNAALKGRGSAQSVPGGVVVRPAFSLPDAMTVSKRLTDRGLNVIIRPASVDIAPGGGAPGALHAVRVGSYPDRSRALAARDELGSKGHGGGILTQGSAK